jgi:hypothetical protein
MKPAIAFVSGSLVPAIAIFCLGGSARACLIAGCLAAVIPALLFARKVGRWLYWVADAVDAVRGVSVSRERNRVQAPHVPDGERLRSTLTVVRRGPKTYTTSAANSTLEAKELASALINLGTSRLRANQIAQQVGPGSFEERLRAAVQMARVA